jgi:drug/metabolite transporter, DME family
MDVTAEIHPAVTERARLNRGYTIALTGVLFWSTTAIFITYLLKNYPLAPMTLAFWRDLFVAIALAIGLTVFQRRALRIEARNRRVLIAYGLALTLMNVTWTFSVALNGAAVSTVLVYSSPGITAIAGRFFFKERFGLVRAIAFMTSLIGCVLVARANDPSQWNVNAAGIVIGILSAFGFSSYSLMGKVVSRRRINSWTANLGAFSVAAIALLFIALISLALAGQGDTLLSLGTHFDGWLVLIVLAVIPTLGGYGLYSASLGYLPTGTSNLIATLEPALTTILAYILLHESLTVSQLIGGVLIVASVISLRLEER